MKRIMKLFLFRSGFILLSILILTSMPVQALEMKAGTAKGVIIPEDWETNYRISVMGSPLKDVQHDIHARVLTLYDGGSRMAIVTYDLNCLDVATPILRVRCRDELGIDPAYLVLMGTHNHAAPIQIVPDNFDYGRWLADRIFDLIKEAIDNERGPVKVMFGTGDGDMLRSDIRYPGVYGLRGRPIDEEIQVLKVMQGDEVTALLFNQATHPLQASFSKIEVGHPGYAMDEIEARMPGTLAMYAAACGADQFSRKGLVVIASKGTVKKVGAKLAEKVMEISEGPMVDVTGPLSSRLDVISLPLGPPLSQEEALELVRKEKIPTDIGFVPYPHPDRWSNWVRSLIRHYEEGIPFPKRTTDRVCTDDAFLVRELDVPREFPCIYEETIAARIGPMVFVAIQGEVCAPIGKRIKDEFRDDMPIMLFAYMGEHNLYIPTRELVGAQAYQYKVIQIQYASPVPWAEGVEDEMVEGVIKIIDAVIE